MKTTKLMADSNFYKNRMTKIVKQHEAEREDLFKVLQMGGMDSATYIAACKSNLKVKMKRAGLLNKYLPH